MTIEEILAKLAKGEVLTAEEISVLTKGNEESKENIALANKRALELEENEKSLKTREAEIEDIKNKALENERIVRETVENEANKNLSVSELKAKIKESELLAERENALKAEREKAKLAHTEKEKEIDELRKQVAEIEQSNKLQEENLKKITLITEINNKKATMPYIASQLSKIETLIATKGVDVVRGLVETLDFITDHEKEKARFEQEIKAGGSLLIPKTGEIEDSKNSHGKNDVSEHEKKLREFAIKNGFDVV